MEAYGAISDIEIQKPWACASCGVVRNLNSLQRCRKCARGES